MFCKICGKELNEHAFACPNCGCLVNEGVYKKKKSELAGTNGSNDKLLKTFLIIAFSCSMASLLFAMASVIYPYLSVELYSGYYTYTVSYWRTGSTAIPAFIFGIFALGTGITSFVLGLKKKDNVLQMISIINFILCIFVYIIACLAFGNCCEL